VRFLSLLAIALALFVGSAAWVQAMIAPDYDIETTVFYGELVIFTSFAEDRGVEVKEVRMGEATAGARIAHGSLVAIVGKDLGKDPAPWIAWFEAQQK
jgi:hypothetical protein